MRLVGRFFIALVVCLANFASSLKLSMSTDISKYGSKLFKGKVAKSYLNKAGLQDDCVEKAEWATNGDEDKMAAAILEWCVQYSAVQCSAVQCSAVQCSTVMYLFLRGLVFKITKSPIHPLYTH
jgi:hypothetical protein